MTAEEIEKELNILEIQRQHGDLPWPEYERKKRELERKLDGLCDDTDEKPR